MLVLTRKEKETIQIGESITIHIARINGNKVRIGIEAPEDVRVLRSELCSLAEDNSKTGVTSLRSSGSSGAQPKKDCRTDSAKTAQNVAEDQFMTAI